MDNVSLAHHLGSFQNPAFVTDQPALRGKGIGAPSHGGSSKLWIRANGTSGCMVVAPALTENLQHETWWLPKFCGEALKLINSDEAPEARVK